MIFEPLPAKVVALCHLHEHHREVAFDDAGRLYVRRSDGKGRTAGPFEAPWQAEVAMMADLEAEAFGSLDDAATFEAARRLTVAQVLTGRWHR